MDTKIIISKEKLLHNVSVLHSLLKEGTQLSCCIKANAYGHGLLQVGKVLDESELVARLNVFSLQEAKELRRGGVTKPIQIFGPVDTSDLEETIKEGFSFMSTGENLDAVDVYAKEMNRIAQVHLKVDTGMSRYGVWYEDAIEVIKKINSYDHISLEGVMTHFATSEEVDSLLYDQQKERFQKVVFECANAGIKPEFFHAANSAAVVRDEGVHYDMVRPGIAVYGLKPGPQINKILEDKGLELQPILEWTTHVAQVHNLKKGESVSYGATFTAPRDLRVAVIPVGYFDGYDRGLSNEGFVRIKNEVCSVLGRITMNNFVVDISHVENVLTGDQVTLISENVSADHLASRLGTINYEITTRLGGHITRIVE